MLSLVIVLCAYATNALPWEDGRWVSRKYGNDGKYIPTDEGKYIHVPNPYIHMHNPYAGGFGPYAHWMPAEPRYRYVQTPPKDMFFYKEGYYRNNGIKILSQNHNYEKDKYNFDFETENKIRAEEKAVLKNVDQKDEMISSSGFYEYIGNDGYKYRVDYTADENGFRPKMKRLETPYSGKWILEKLNDDGKYFQRHINSDEETRVNGKNNINLKKIINNGNNVNVDIRSNTKLNDESANIENSKTNDLTTYDEKEKNNESNKDNSKIVKSIDFDKTVDNTEFIFETNVNTEKNITEKSDKGVNVESNKSFEVVDYVTTEENV